MLAGNAAESPAMRWGKVQTAFRQGPAVRTMASEGILLTSNLSSRSILSIGRWPLAEPYKLHHIRLRAIEGGQLGIWRIFHWHTMVHMRPHAGLSGLPLIGSATTQRIPRTRFRAAWGAQRVLCKSRRAPLKPQCGAGVLMERARRRNRQCHSCITKAFSPSPP